MCQFYLIKKEKCKEEMENDVNRWPQKLSERTGSHKRAILPTFSFSSSFSDRCV